MRSQDFEFISAIGIVLFQHSMSTLVELFNAAHIEVPEILSNWEDQVQNWCRDYENEHSDAEISEINIDCSVFLFDHGAERVVLAYAVSVEQLMQRDKSRMQGFPDVKISEQVSKGNKKLVADKGHFLGHASGGSLDINLFPHHRDLNQGWSAEGKRFRSMERYVAEHPGTFFYHRPIYDDDTWIPANLEYGLLVENKEWWVDTFKNS